MKKRLNILCLLVLLVLSYSVFESIYYMSEGFKAGATVGMNAHKDKTALERLQYARHVAMFPDNLASFPDSIRNEKTGEYVPVLYDQLIVSVKGNITLWQQFTVAFMPIAQVFLALFAVIIFCKLIIAINKSHIFNWKNVRRLRRVGIAMILFFAASAIPVWITSSVISSSLVIKGYTFAFSSLIDITHLVLGIASLIVAEVFAIGLRIQEDQELTI